MKFVIAIAVFLSSLACNAQPTTSLVIPSGVGGVVHRYANELAPAFSKMLGSTVVLDFKPGGAGIVAAKHVADKSGPDITLLIGAAHRWDDPNFTQLDNKPIAFLGVVPGLVISKPNENYKDYKQFLEYARKNKASFGVVSASANQPLFKKIHRREQVELIEVPYKSGGAVTVDVLGGHIDAGATVADAVAQMVLEGKLTGLAVYADERSSFLPHVPTLKELGLSAKDDFKYYNNYFLWVNKSADPDKVKQFTQQLYEFLQSKEAEAIMKKIDVRFGNRSFRNPETTLKNIIQD